MSKVVSLIEKYLVGNGGNRLDEKKLQILGTQLTYFIYQPDSRPWPKHEYDQYRKDLITIYTGDNHKVDSHVTYELYIYCEPYNSVSIMEIRQVNNKATRGTKINYDIIEIYKDGKKQGKKDVFFEAKSMNKVVFSAYNDNTLDPYYPEGVIGGKRLSDNLK